MFGIRKIHYLIKMEVNLNLFCHYFRNINDALLPPLKCKYTVLKQREREREREREKERDTQRVKERERVTEREREIERESLFGV